MEGFSGLGPELVWGLVFALDPGTPSERVSWKPPSALGFIQRAEAAVSVEAGLMPSARQKTGLLSTCEKEEMTQMRQEIREQRRERFFLSWRQRTLQRSSCRGKGSIHEFIMYQHLNSLDGQPAEFYAQRLL